MAVGSARRSGVRMWFLVVLITVASAFYQRVTGPSYPVRAKVQWQGQTIRARLERTHGGPGDQRVEVRGVGADTRGDLFWRRYPTEDPFIHQGMAYEGDRLTGVLPHQPPAGKLEYRIMLHGGDGTLSLPKTGSVVTRFKGHVPLSILIPHIILMFAAMLLSNRAGIGALWGDAKFAAYAKWVLGLLLAGGMILGPAVQKLAFGSYWTGVPIGWDLTDNKTLISIVGWLAAFWAQRRNAHARMWTIAAALITLIVFLIPHSLFGSELRVE
jgi:hypothetical protein